MRSQLRRVRGLQILQVRHESVHFAQHLLNPLWPTPADARNPFELVSDLWVQLIPPVVPLLDEPLLLQLRQERIDRARGGSPPTLGHLLDRVHDFRSVLGTASDQGERPHAQTSPPVHLPSEGPHGYRQSDIGIPIYQTAWGMPTTTAVSRLTIRGASGPLPGSPASRRSSRGRGSAVGRGRSRPRSSGPEGRRRTIPTSRCPCDRSEPRPCGA